MRGAEGDIDRAIKLGEQALGVWFPGSRLDDKAEHEHLLADQHYWTGNYGRALELSRAEREQAIDPSSAEALLRGGGMEGLLLTAMGRYEEALASFDRVIAVGRELGRPVPGAFELLDDGHFGNCMNWTRPAVGVRRP